MIVDSTQLALVKRIVHPLELGEVSDGPLNVSTEWRRRIERAAIQRGVASDYAAEDIRTWIAELGFAGLDKPVSNLIIASFALLADRAWVLHGSPLSDPPDLDKIGPGHALRAQELPSAEEFAAARHRAAVLFGSHVPDMLFARNVNRLAGEVGEKVAAFEAAVNDVRRSLDRHAIGLGLTPGSDRVATIRQAADLLARLSTARDATALARELAGANYEATDEVLASAITSAPAVLAALDRVDWSLLESVRGFTGRGDGLAERAERLLGDVARAAAADEIAQQLVPILDGVRHRAVELINEAARLASVTPPVPGAPIRVTESVHPPASGTQVSPVRPPRRFRAGAVGRELALLADEVLAEIHDPAAEIEVVWRVVGEDGP